MNANHDKPVLALTMGDVNGVGPEILAKALAHSEVAAWCRPIVLGDAAVYDQARKFAPAAPPAFAVEEPTAAAPEGAVAVFNAGSPAPTVRPAVIDPDAGRAAIEWVKAAVRFTQEGVFDGLVTGPIHKEAIHRAGIDVPGHTELIANMTGSPDYRMCLFTDTMRVVHISSHCSLRQALDQVQTERIAESIRIGHDALVRLGLPTRRIAVAGLNPHAGEGGAFGNEEPTIILPAIERCREEGIDCSGPWPPDTLFGRMRDGEFDMVIALYHDQGHIPMKLIAMDEGVNVTLGIPIVRTSVDHGTAFDIAWQGSAREHSLCAAIRFAAQLAAHTPAGRAHA